MVGIFGLIAAGFMIWASWKAWGPVAAAALGAASVALGLFLPFIGGLASLIASVVIYNQAAIQMVDNAVEEEGEGFGETGGDGESREL